MAIPIEMPLLKKGTSLFLAVCLALAFTFAPVNQAGAAGRQIYVSPSGNDASTGTSTAPMKTIQAAVNAAVPGDTVIVRAGTYGRFVVNNKTGTSTAPIVIKAYTGETPVVKTFGVTNSSFITVDGLEVWEWKGATFNESVGTYLNNTKNVTIQNSHYRWNVGGGSYGGAIFMSEQTYNNTNATIRNNEIENRVFVSGVGHQVLNNYFHDGKMEDSLRFFGRDILIKGNRFSRWIAAANGGPLDPAAHIDSIQTYGSVAGPTSNIDIDSNLFEASHQGQTMMLEALKGAVSDITFSNNIVLKDKLVVHPISINNKQSTLGYVQGIKVINNTFASLDGRQVQAATFSGGSGHVFQNNIVYNELHYTILGGASVSRDYNLIYNPTGWMGNPNEAHGLWGIDPKFVNAGARDYHLAAGSAARDSANGTLAPVTDKDGKGRYDDPNMVNKGGGTPTYADRGAFEAGGTVVSPTPEPTPDPTPVPEPTPTPTPTPSPEPTTAPAPTDTVAPTGWFTVNGGATETSSTTVSIKNYITGATKMRFDVGSGYSAWAPYAATTTLTLPSGDGDKRIAAQYSDDAGNIHSQATTIKLVSAPVGTMSINADASYTSSNTVGVYSTVAGATMMRCNSGNGYADWHPYEQVHPLALPLGDGVKKVAVEYMSSAGATMTLEDTVILDTTAPTGTFSINSGATSTKSTNVTAYNNVSGATEMRFDTGTGFGAWAPYAGTKALTLPAGNGTKTVKAEYRDAAGNVTSLTDTINLFGGKNKLNGGTTYTTSRYVTLASYVGGAVDMRIDTGAGYGDWTPYADKRVVLPFGDGSKTVTAQYRDRTGATLTLSDSIILDRTAPIGSFKVNRGARYTYSRAVDINSSVRGASLMRIKTGTKYGSWYSYKSVRKAWVTNGKGTKRVYVQYRDRAGNIVTRTDTIVRR